MSTNEYKEIFDRALCLIRAIRDPHANNANDEDLMWDRVLEHNLLKIDDNYTNYNLLISETWSIIKDCLYIIISRLNDKYCCGLNIIDKDDNTGFLQNAILLINDPNNNTLFILKTIELSKFWKSEEEPQEIVDIMDKYHAKTCKYIYLMDDYAYLQVFGYNEDENDPGRGTNLYGMKYLFDYYFVNENFSLFKEQFNEFNKSVKESIGYSCIKNLNPHALINFKYITLSKLQNYKYYKLVHSPIIPDKGINKNQECSIGEKDYEDINCQFKSDVISKLFMTDLSFIESLVTSEWLRESLVDCQAIDLTSIGSGYFKASEQLLYYIICLHKDEHRKIKLLHSNKDDDLSRVNINKNEYLDFSMGSMANFFKNNKDLFNNSIMYSINYIYEYIFEYCDLRNGYFHKDNIHDMNIIDNIRDKTYKLFFLILGSINFRDKDYIEMKLPSMNYYDDYYRLCEFVNFHSYDLFFIVHGEYKSWYISQPDTDTRIVDNHVTYSGIYFKKLGKEEKYQLDQKGMPNTIYYGKLAINNSKTVGFEPKIICKIFEKGKFIGPDIKEDKQYTY